MPLDAHVRLLKQTTGGLVFLQGHCEQDGEICYAFTGTLKRITAARQATMGPVAKAYAALVAAGELKPDPDQAARGPGARPLRRATSVERAPAS